MSRYFAEIDNQGTVLRVIVADSKEWCEQNLGGTWIETFVDRPDKNYAGIGCIYHYDKDNFSRKKPFDSWILKEDCTWEAPVAIPKDASVENIKWDENKQDWVDKETFFANIEIN